MTPNCGVIITSLIDVITWHRQHQSLEIHQNINMMFEQMLANGITSISLCYTTTTTFSGVVVVVVVVLHFN